MTRVLITEFSTIVGLGVREVLAEGGCEIVSRSGSLTEEMISEVGPNAVVVDVDAIPAAGTEQLVSAFPGIPFVECSSTRARMRVFPAYRFGESYCADFTPDVLVEAVTTI